MPTASETWEIILILARVLAVPAFVVFVVWMGHAIVKSPVEDSEDQALSTTKTLYADETWDDELGPFTRDLIERGKE